MNKYRICSAALIVAFGLISQAAVAGTTATGYLLGAPTQLAQSPLLSKNFGSATVGSTVNGTTETVTVQITPPPGNLVDITDISIAGANPGDFQVTGGSCVNATGRIDQDTCTLDLSFTPSAAGTRSGILNMTCRIVSAAIGPIGLVCDNTSRPAFNLSGTGILAAIAQSIPTLGREGVTLLALLLFAATFLVLRRR
jgi:hypothetical protein